MAILGLILLILGLIFAIKILWVIGAILLVIGLVIVLTSRSRGGGWGAW